MYLQMSKTDRVVGLLPASGYKLLVFENNRVLSEENIIGWLVVQHDADDVVVESYPVTTTGVVDHTAEERNRHYATVQPDGQILEFWELRSCPDAIMHENRLVLERNLRERRDFLSSTKTKAA